MNHDIINLSQHFLNLNNRPFQRYLLNNGEIKHRSTILLGQKGIGKTTTLTQLLLKHSKGDIEDPRILYVPTDHFLISNTSLYEIAQSFQSMGGELIAFDEIHKYPNWSQELKSIYDTFPKLFTLVSGSSVLEIHRGSHDLSRRMIIHFLHGLSFREFIELNDDIKLPVLSLDDIIHHHAKLARGIVMELEKHKKRVLPLYKKYINYGYYPYFLDIKDKDSYWMTLEQNIHATIESDLTAAHPQLTGKSVQKIKQLLAFISRSVPFTPNWSTLKRVTDIKDDRTIKNYFKFLEDACLIQSMIGCSNKLAALEATEKIFLHNPNQIQALTSGNGDIGNIRETFFISMLKPQHKLCVPKNGDFVVDKKWTFEIGGNKKNNKQIHDINHAYLISDNIEIGNGNRIPLWLFGFLY